MTVHILRDYKTEGTGYANNIPSVSIAYIVAIFLRRVLGYSVVGQTNFNIDSYLQASGTAGTGFGAGMLDGYTVSIPTSRRTVSSTDVGKPLCLKSNTNPLKNSGVFKIVSVDTVNNRYVVDYRSNDDSPVEASDSISWYLFDIETNFNPTNTGNSGSGYLGNGSATCSRIILQSPDVSGWQIRLCYEPSVGGGNSNFFGLYSYAVGFGGNTAGDFAVSGQHTHTPLFYNVDPTVYSYSVPFFGDYQNAYRITLIGDDTGLNVVGTLRSQVPSVIGQYNNSQNIMFGLPSNEPVSLVQNQNRIFTYGGGRTNSYVGFILNTAAFGVAYGLGGVPIVAAPSAWTYLKGANSVPSTVPNGPAFDTSAGDCPFTGSTELFGVDLFAGQYLTSDTAVGSTHQIFPIEPRLMGSLPYIRQGRANFGNYTLTSDKAWMHLENGMYLQWGGTGVVP